MRARSRRVGCDVENLVVYGVCMSAYRETTPEKFVEIVLIRFNSYLRGITSIFITVSWRPQY